MNTKTFTLLSLFTLLLVGIPMKSHASSIFVSRESDTAIVGDTIVLQVFLDTEGKTVNVIDGSLSYSGFENATVSEVSTADSVFTLWPNRPSIIRSESSISFVGGVPKGVTGTKLPLFKIIVEPKKPGQFSVQGVTITTYENDGKGTGAVAKVMPFTLGILPNEGHVVVNEWSNVLKADTNPPRKFIADLGRDISVYDNKYFISFETSDDESGIAYFEVQEGGLPVVRSGSPYVLQTQNPNELIMVTAFDRAGNKTVSYVNQSHTARNITILTIVILFGFYFIRSFLKKSRNQPHA